MEIANDKLNPLKDSAITPTDSQPTIRTGWELNPYDIVISGISGQMPNCANLKEYRESLFNRKELLSPTKDSWNIELPDLPPTLGKVHEWCKFDAEYFGFDSALIDKLLDPQSSKVIEDVYEAVLDAGMHPSGLKGRKIAVVVGTSLSEPAKLLYYDPNDQTQRQFNAWRAMIPHFVSSFFGLKGASYITDTACSSFMYAFTKAYEAMENGECESAIVCCSNLLYSHITMVQFYRLGVLSSTPHCRPMDVEGDGYVRSEAVGAIFLQRARGAKRIYAVVEHAETSADGLKEENITFPSRAAQAKLLRSVYSKDKVDAQALTYMEVHGTGTKVGDPVELGAIEDVFYEEGRRTTPLLIGSVKSNLGHAEASSGFCSLAKILIMMQTGQIPPTINFTAPRKEISSLHNGRLKVVAESTLWEPGLVAINNFGFGGANAHLVLRPGPRRRFKKSLPGGTNIVPRLVMASGRTEEAALALVQLTATGGADVDVELVRLLHELSATPTPGHPHRAFALAPAPAKYAPVARRCGDARPPVWLALAGAGAWADEWAAVGAALLRLPAFAKALRHRDAPLPDLLSDALSYAGAVQEAIFEVLRAAGVREQGVVMVEAAEARAFLEEGVVLLVAPAGEATREARAVLGTGRDAERVVALFGDFDRSNFLMEFLCALGRLYCLGVNLNSSVLYEEITFPVSVETPMISPYILWDHTKVSMPMSLSVLERSSGADVIRVAPMSHEYKFMKGHIIDKRNLLPATGYLYIVWNAFAESILHACELTSVVFEDVRFLRSTHLPKDYGQLILQVTVHCESGAFEVSEGNTAIATGYIHLMTDKDRSQMLPPAEPWDPSADDSSPHMTPRDVYKVLRLRGYNYSGLFRGIAAASCDGSRGLLRWDDNWVTFLDCMMQLQLLPDASGTLAVPTAIQRFSIDVSAHKKHLHDHGSNQVATALVNTAVGAVRAGGVELQGLRANVIARRKPTGDPVLERYDFAPYYLDVEEDKGGEEEETWAEAVRVCAQIVLENRGPAVRGAPPLVALEVLTERAKRLLAPLLLAALSDLPLVQVRLKLFLADNVEEEVKEAAEATASDMVANVAALREETDAVFVVGCGLLRSGWINQVARVLAPTGCLITMQEMEGEDDEEQEEARTRVAGLRLVLRWRRGRQTLVLLRKGGWEEDACNANIVHIGEEVDDEAGQQFHWLPTLQAALREARGPKQRVLLVAQGQPLAGAQGLFNCLRQELGPNRDKLRLYVLEEGAEPFSLHSDVYRRQLEVDVAVNELRHGRWGCSRHFPIPGAATTEKVKITNVGAKHAYCDVVALGDLSSFCWFEGDLDPDKPSPVPGEELVHVYYAALNFKDVMLASGKLNAASVYKAPGQKCLLGFEVAGRTVSGRRVMGVSAMAGCISNLATCRSCFLWDVPDHWTLEQAASVPTAYSTAVYALWVRGRMRRGESILVHAGSGGMGQATIHLALAQGCRVFATAGTDEKRRFLLRTFPQLSAEDVGNSRDASFEALVLRRTAGRGVDLVLNSLAGDKLLASLRCLAPGGRFLEIGKFDMEKNTLLDAADLSRGRRFHGVHLDMFWFSATLAEQHELAETIRQLLQDGSIKPLSTNVFERGSVEQAFRFMTGGKHIGKVVIRIRPEEKMKRALPCPIPIIAGKRFYCLPESSYLICGGLGGLGLELADWLVGRGCRHLVLTSRRGVSNGYQARKMLLWERKGVRVHIFTGDAATHAGADALLRAANALAPLAAIFNLAVVLRDALFDNQTVDAFVESYRCKALATRRLDAASRRLCPRLAHFVVFSSVSCGRGNAGQTNYGLANSVMEGVVRARREAGLPATAVQWGAVGDVGLVADMRDDDRQLEIGGTLQQRLSSCLEVLDGFLTGGGDGKDNGPVFSSMVVAEKRSGGHGGDLVALVADTFGIKDVRTVSPESTLAELGLDSMMAVEIQQALERDFDISLTVQELRGLTFSRLREIQKKQREEKEGRGEREFAVQETFQIFPWEQFLPLVREFTSVDESICVKAMGDGVGYPILMLPGGDDHPPFLEPLAARLERPSGCLYMGTYCDRVTLSKMVDAAMPVVRNYFEGQPFALLGYSYGGVFALEIASRLEESGLRGSVVLLDASPSFVIEAFLAQIQGNFRSIDDIPDAHMEGYFAFNLLKVFEGLSKEEAHATLATCGNWEQRLKRALKGAKKQGFSPEVLAALVEKTIARAGSLRGYNWPESRPLLASPITLVRPTKSPFPVQDYGLSKFCTRSVRVRCVDGVDHQNILMHTVTAEIANEIFSGNVTE